MPVFTRCVLSWIDPEAGPDDRLTIDLLLDGEPRHVVNFGAPTLGINGGFGGNATMYPFVLRPDGTLDFGSYGDENWEINVLNPGRIIELGELFTVVAKGEESTYRITDLRPLLNADVL